MKRPLICGLAFGWMSALVFSGTATAAPFAYVTNSASNTVSVIDLATESVTGLRNIAGVPVSLAITPDGRKVYVGNDRGNVSAPPAIQVFFDSGIAPAEDVTDQALSAGQGTNGNQFEFSDGKWRFNLQTKNYTAAGTYTVIMVSGDDTEYAIDPTCIAEFVIE